MVSSKNNRYLRTAEDPTDVYSHKSSLASLGIDKNIDPSSSTSIGHFIQNKLLSSAPVTEAGPNSESFNQESKFHDKWYLAEVGILINPTGYTNADAICGNNRSSMSIQWVAVNSHEVAQRALLALEAAGNEDEDGYTSEEYEEEEPEDQKVESEKERKARERKLELRRAAVKRARRAPVKATVNAPVLTERAVGHTQANANGNPPPPMSFLWNYLLCPRHNLDHTDIEWLMSAFRMDSDPALDEETRSATYLRLGWTPAFQSLRTVLDVSDYHSGRTRNPPEAVKRLRQAEVDKGVLLMGMGAGILLFLPKRTACFRPTLQQFGGMRGRCSEAVIAAFEGPLARVVKIWAGKDQVPTGAKERLKFLLEVQEAMDTIVETAKANKHQLWRK